MVTCEWHGWSNLVRNVAHLRLQLANALVRDVLPLLDGVHLFAQVGRLVLRQLQLNVTIKRLPG